MENQQDWEQRESKVPCVRSATGSAIPSFEAENGCRQGEERFREFVLPYISELKRYCMSLARTAWDAEDTLQETLLKMHVVLQKRDLHGYPKAYLFRVARNVWTDRCRSNKRMEAMVGAVQLQLSRRTEHDFSDYIATEDMLQSVLTDTHRSMMKLAYIYAYSLNEVAAALHTTVPTVKAALHRSRRKVREWEARCAQGE